MKKNIKAKKNQIKQVRNIRNKAVYMSLLSIVLVMIAQSIYMVGKSTLSNLALITCEVSTILGIIIFVMSTISIVVLIAHTKNL